MEIARFWRHIAMSPVAAARAFPSATLDAIQREIAARESAHGGEICFVVETELTTGQLWRDLDSRSRAREVFAARGVWNTEHNNGVLIYLLLADRKVEIVADRGIDRVAEDEDWRRIARLMEGSFRDGRYEEGAIAGVRAVAELIAAHFPAPAEKVNELPDRPIVI